MEYEEVIKHSMAEVIKKKEHQEDKIYWEWVLSQLASDLLEYQGRARWLREPFDEAFQKYRVATSFPSVDDIIRRFFEGFF
jgi:hypothetical protein